MSYMKFSSNLFLEVAELNRFQDFQSIDGFRKNILQNTAKFGLIRSRLDPGFLNGRVERDADTTDQQKTIKIRTLQAIDNQGRFLAGDEIGNIIIPADGRWYWVKVKHKYKTTEVGKVSLAVNGDMTGIGTKFTEVLRGMPNFPSRIRFQNSKFNTLEYDVLEVIDDQHATLMHPALNGTGIATFDVETELTYSVVGTFTPGVATPEGDKYPFQYDAMTYELVAETNVNERPVHIEDQEFFLARVRVTGGDVVLQDKRVDQWETRGSYGLIDIEESVNPLIGVEYIKYQNLLSPAYQNEVYVAWGMRTQNWSVDSSKNIITFFGSATGGKYKTIDNFTNGDFDGWRVYSANGKFSRVTSSIKQGSAINMTLDILDVDNYSTDGGITFKNEGDSADWIMVVPNCEEIEIIFTPDALSGNANSSSSFRFPINTLIGRCDVENYVDPKSLFNVRYRYKNNKRYTGSTLFSSDPIGYWTEISFDNDGNLKAPEDRVRKPYVATEAGYIELTLSPNSFTRFANRVYKGDKIGVQTITTFSNAQVLDLQVGVNKRYLYITGEISLGDDIYINLVAADSVEGNQFTIHLNCTSLQMNGKTIKITRGRELGAPVTIKTIAAPDAYSMLNQDNGIVFNCVVSDGGLWTIASQNYSNGAPQEIKTISGSTDQLFDSGGLGKVKGLFGYALCDGRNNTVDLVDKFILGAGRSGNNIVTPGVSGGNNTAVLSINNIPAHDHYLLGGPGINTPAITNQPDRTASAKGDSPDDNEDWNYAVTSVQETARYGKSSSVGQGTAFNIKNPYYALIFAQKLY